MLVMQTFLMKATCVSQTQEVRHLETATLQPLLTRVDSIKLTLKYKSSGVACPDHDICAECWLDGARTTHDPTHAFVKLRDRADFFPGEGDPNEVAGNACVTGARRAVHWGITCDGCSVENMAGVRYQCKV